MKYIIKLVLVIVIAGLTASSLYKWYNVYIIGGYFTDASFFIICMGALLPMVGLIISLIFIVKIIRFRYKKKEIVVDNTEEDSHE